MNLKLFDTKIFINLPKIGFYSVIVIRYWSGQNFVVFLRFG